MASLSANENNSDKGESDNSALVSIGNTSFGFNFDSAEDQSPNNSDRDESAAKPEGLQQMNEPSSGLSGAGAASASGTTPMAAAATSAAETQPIQQAAAFAQAAGLAGLQGIATSNGAPLSSTGLAIGVMMNQGQQGTMLAPPSPGRKRKSTASAAADEEENSAGYHTDDEGRSIAGSASVQGGDDTKKAAGGRGGSGNKKKRLDEKKREERNMREKERSLRISKQINELRNLLSSGGVIVPKGTKSSVLTEAANYIRMLQQHQYRSELDRHQLIQQMQMIGQGAHGAQAAKAIRHVAAQNGVWSLGNFGGVPPKSAMSFYQQPATEASSAAPTENPTSSNPAQHPNNIDTSEYKFVFNSCGVAMAIASLGGAFIDCNQLFCQLSNYSKQEICGLTIFNLTDRQDLQHAFDLISQMISPPLEVRSQEPRPIVLRGSMKNRNDIGLSISLVKGEDGIAKCFCATLIKNPASPFDTAKPIPVSFDAIQGASLMQPTQPDKQDLAGAAPAFTLG